MLAPQSKQEMVIKGVIGFCPVGLFLGVSAPSTLCKFPQMSILIEIWDSSYLILAKVLTSLLNLFTYLAVQGKHFKMGQTKIKIAYS